MIFPTSRIILFPLLVLAAGVTFTSPPTGGVHSELVYPEQLPGSYTGGFGEETCHSCHFDYPVNDNSGSVRIEQLPTRFEPSETYTLTVIVSRDNIGKAGFQLTSRFTDGRQAGRLSAIDNRVMPTNPDTGSVIYLQHSPAGSTPTNTNRSKWKINWQAPPRADTVLFHIAGNAGNGDASEFGDFINTLRVQVLPSP